MADSILDLVDALRARIALVWPETLPGGIWPAEHVSQITWEDLRPPYSVIHIYEAAWKPEHGLTNHTEGIPVDVYYVAEVSGPLSGIVGKLGLLQDDLLHPWRYGGLDAGQVLGVTARKWGDDLLPNQIFAAKNMSHRAGRLTANCIAGVIL